MTKVMDLMLPVKKLQKKMTKSWRQYLSKYDKNKKISAVSRNLSFLSLLVVFCSVVIIEVFETASVVRILRAK